MKTRLFLTSLFILVITTLAFAQEDDYKQSKTYNPGDFTSIALNGGFRVYLIQGDHCGIEVKANSSKVFENIKISRNGEDVSIKIDQSFFEYSRIGLYITFKDLQKIVIEGGVNLKTDGYLNLGDLYVEVKGGANIDLFLKSDKLEVLGEGGFLFEIKGVTKLLDVRISGAGHVSAGELKAREAVFKVKGFGTGIVYAENKLDARIEGVGKLRYKGNPEVTQYIDGLGSVKPFE